VASARASADRVARSARPAGPVVGPRAGAIDTTAGRRPTSRRGTMRGVSRSAIAPFVAAIALSAFLLFSVQPLVGRLVLPAFGGVPAAWATVLVSFQLALLVGYGYAHLSVTWLGARRGSLVHLAVLVVAIVVYAAAPARFAEARLTDLPPAIDLLRLLLVTIGLPAVTLAATTPLLSAWLTTVRRARTPAVDPATGDPGPAAPDPYRLYAVSNGGSFVAVAAYPFVIEPLAGLSAQRVAFGVGLVALLGLFAGAAAVVRRATGSASGLTADAAAGDPARSGRTATLPRLDRRLVGRWIVLAAVPAGLLSAVTNFITTDLIAAPLLWIGPLGIYLATLIVAFGGRGPVLARRLASSIPIVVVLLAVPFAAPIDWPIVPLLAIELVGFGLIGLVLHGQLAADRPAPERLTAYYLVVAFGGVLGGAFVGLVAPSVFPDVWEYPILLVAALAAMAISPDLVAAAAAPVHRLRPRSRILDLAPATAGATRRVGIYLALAVVIGLVLSLSRSISIADASTWLLIGAGLLVLGGDIRIFTVATAVVLGLAILNPPVALFRDRSFFGVVEVLQPVPPVFDVLRHGTTVHSLQSTDPALRREPAGYFSRVGPLGDVMDRLDERLDGTIAAYERAGDSMTFIEIDPLMARVAGDPSLFTYLADAAASAGPASAPQVVIGDGRLELEAEPDGAADIVILDAFSSDAVPVHLMTAEALADAHRVTGSTGLLAVNISSRYYALGPAVAAGVEPLGLTVLRRLHDPADAEAERGITTSDWLVATADPADVAWFEGRGWTVVAPADEPLTDDRSDLLRLLRPDMLW
jgi:hypothetical protein